jgi:hypothetical protein
VPNGLIALIVIVLVLAFVGVFVTMRFGPPKDARRRQVNVARDAKARAENTLDDIRNKLIDAPPLDLVGDDLRRQIIDMIRNYEDKEREIRKI